MYLYYSYLFLRLDDWQLRFVQFTTYYLYSYFSERPVELVVQKNVQIALSLSKHLCHNIITEAWLNLSRSLGV